MSSKPEIRTTLQPGQNGTKQLLRQYGDQLVCVRCHLPSDGLTMVTS